jgi:hypothetical protein
MLYLRNRRNGKFDIRPCSHIPEKIKQLARVKDALIVSANFKCNRALRSHPLLILKKEGEVSAIWLT